LSYGRVAGTLTAIAGDGKPSPRVAPPDSRDLVPIKRMPALMPAYIPSVLEAMSGVIKWRDMRHCSHFIRFMGLL